MVPVWHSKEVMLIRVTHLFYNIIFSSGKWSAASAAVFNSLLRTLQFFLLQQYVPIQKDLRFYMHFWWVFSSHVFPSKFFPEKLHQINEKKFDDDGVLFI